jgi:hypothetical protein
VTDATHDSRQRHPTLRQWLFDPFTYIAGGRALAMGLAAIIAAGCLGFLGNAHFDGVLDFHSGRPAALWVFLAEGMIDWLSLAIILLILGRLLSKTAFRALDLLGTQAMARWPTVITAAAALAPPFRRYALTVMSMLSGGGARGSATDAVVFGVVLLVAVCAVVWMVALMYRSYSTCCNLKGAKAIGSFVGGVLAAEVVSKVAVGYLLKL